MSLSIVILAAGQGIRMRSDIPKALHRLAGKSLLEHVYNSASLINHRQVLVVYGYGGEQIKTDLPHLKVTWIEQPEQLGTGHAVQQVISHIPDKDLVMILYGDIPMITSNTLHRLENIARETGFGLLTSYIDNPQGYGRVIRNEIGEVLRIVEEKDATYEERDVCEINTGIMAISSKLLKRWVGALENNNAQKEYYLTDIVAMAVAEGIKINSINPDSAVETRGINNRSQLAEIERYYQLIQAHQLMRRGVTILDPSRFDLRGDIEIGQDILIDINVLLEGRMKIGDHVNIGANCCIRDSVIGDNVEILANCVIENAIIGNACRIGPFARIRPDTVLDEKVHIGNFVEIKKSIVGKESKINHLSYIGDSEIGSLVNVGAGAITCNYDGANKHKTIIEDDVFIGSDVQLIAPVKVGQGATIAAGTTVSKDVENYVLSIGRSEQKTVNKWKRPKKKQ
jgi:bifunctional UDP-N-acetylglucosamine pyrophosphorylase / glucosamine-1-phosphate N-acetyltransferase